MHITPKTHESPTIALIVAGGQGVRFGYPIPKQYVEMEGLPLLTHTIRTFLETPGIHKVLVVIGAEDGAHYASAIAHLASHPKITALLPYCIGGAARQASVRLGLEALAAEAPENVLIHDAVRPFATPALIQTILAALETHRAVIPYLPVTDTVKVIENGHIERTLDRTRLGLIQTPQGFSYPLISRLHQEMQHLNATDDAALCEAAGLPVAAVMGETTNKKITFMTDLLHSTPAMPALVTRVGNGFDAHRFSDAPHAEATIPLCGIPVPHTHSIIAHSDGDVALHALVDAMLGSMGLADIGYHFPPSDPKWRGADSMQFVQYALHLLQQQQATLYHVDITIICEAPRVGPYREAMRQQLATILQLPLSAVSIKATTTEKMGYLGRREGIAALATASVLAPYSKQTLSEAGMSL